ncbi:MAG: hypothetical protein ABIR47_12185 [Candidatus Kapaibacterium sp.]
MIDKYGFFREHDRVDYLWSETSPELGYLYEVFQHLFRYPIARNYRYYIRNREPIPEVGEDVIVIQIGNEDHALPSFANDVFMVFTPYPPAGLLPPNVRSIPLGYNDDVGIPPWIPFDRRENDLFFSGQLSESRHEFAVAVERALQMPEMAGRKCAVNFTRKFRTGIDPSEYASLLMNSKIALAPPGTFSPVTFRFFEASRFGNVIISPPLPDTWYYRESPAIRLDDWDHLPGLLAALTRDQDHLRELHHQTVRYYTDCCAEPAVARYMADAIAEMALFLRH